MTTLITDLPLLVSLRSRSGKSLAKRLLEQPAQGVTLYPFSNDAEFENLLSAATRGVESPTVLIGGGDGTIGRAIQVIGSSMRIGIVPLGTGNALAHELELPLNPHEAIDYLVREANPREVDYARFADKCFVTVATKGVTSQIAKFVRTSPKRIFGRLVYLPALIRAVRFAKAFRIKISTEREVFEGDVIQFVAANTKLHGGAFSVTEKASIEDGMVSIYAVESASRGDLFRYGLSLVRGKQTQLPTVWSAESRFSEVEVRNPSDFVLDGDPFQAKAVRLESIPGGLHLLA